MNCLFNKIISTSLNQQVFYSKTNLKQKEILRLRLSKNLFNFSVKYKLLDLFFESKVSFLFALLWGLYFKQTAKI